jgi:pyridoxamine 5'-phosphate oxidase
MSPEEPAGDPIEQFRRWFADAAAEPEPEAMSLATVGTDGAPSVRFVLLKEVVATGFVFYTNHTSRKGIELAANPRAALVWRWVGLDRQVRAAGPVRRVDDARSDSYFAGRPRGSQLGAWASAQSSVLTDRAELTQRVLDAEQRFDGVDVPRPPWWGGYLVEADEVEFWQGRDDRLHDRFRYRRGTSGWQVERLSP